MWNVNGWSKYKNSDNSRIRESVLNYLNLDIIGVCETFLKTMIILKLVVINGMAIIESLKMQK